MAKIRVFKEDWKLQFKWLEYNKERMFCNVCCRTRMKNSFTTGCMNFQHSTRVRHIDIHSKDGQLDEFMNARN